MTGSVAYRDTDVKVRSITINLATSLPDAPANTLLPVAVSKRAFEYFTQDSDVLEGMDSCKRLSPYESHPDFDKIIVLIKHKWFGDLEMLSRIKAAATSAVVAATRELA